MEHSSLQPGSFSGLYEHLNLLARELAHNEALAFHDKKATLRITREELPLLTIDAVIDGARQTVIWDGERGRGLHYPVEADGQRRRVPMMPQVQDELRMLAWSDETEHHVHLDGLTGVVRKTTVSRVRLELTEPTATHVWYWDEQDQDPHPVSISASGSESLMAVAKQLGRDHYLICINWSRGTTLYTFRIPG